MPPGNIGGIPPGPLAGGNGGKGIPRPGVGAIVGIKGLDSILCILKIASEEGLRS